MMNDKLHSHADTDELVDMREEIKARNDREAQEIDNIFARYKSLEVQIKEQEAELEAERHYSDRIVQDMAPQERERFMEAKHMLAALESDLEGKKQELERLDGRIQAMEMDLQQNPVKREAVSLYGQLQALYQKRDTIVAEMEAEKKSNPEELGRLLLQQVKTDNQEITSMERRMAEIQSEMSNLQHELDDDDEEEEQGPEAEEKRKKYMQLLKREEEMKAFLNDFDENKETEEARVEKAQTNIVTLLEHISRNLQRGGQLPSQSEHDALKQDLAFKAREMEKSQLTTESLAERRKRLVRDLENVHQLEDKIAKEMESIKANTASMRDELISYNNLDLLKAEMAQKQGLVQLEKKRLQARQKFAAKLRSDMEQEYQAAKTALEADATHQQLAALEKKWAQLEKNNFVVCDFIQSREAEANFSPYVRTVTSLIKEYNHHLRAQAKSK